LPRGVEVEIEDEGGDASQLWPSSLTHQQSQAPIAANGNLIALHREKHVVKHHLLLGLSRSP
ncbi:hypothetical protein CEXT_338441, partial [Caerostris extrusa]